MRSLGSADVRDTTDDRVGWEAGDDGLLDVDSVLRENNGRFTRGNSRLNDVGRCW